MAALSSLLAAARLVAFLGVPLAAPAPASKGSEPPPAEAPPPPEPGPLPAYRDRDRKAVSKPEEARGVEQEPGEPEDALLFAPRAVLFVPNLALKLAFLPVNALATLMSRYALIERTVDLLYNDERTAAILPAVSLQTGYGLSYGATAFHHDLFGHEEKGELKAKYGGIYRQGYQVAFQADHAGGSNLWIDSVVRYEQKPALLFSGIGDPPDVSLPATPIDPRSGAISTRFHQERVLATLGAGLSVGESPVTKVGPTVIFNRRKFGRERRNVGDPSIETVYDTALIPGFDDTLDLLEFDLELVHDENPNVALPASGAYFEGFAGGVPEIGDYTFLHAGAEVTEHIDLYKGNRVLVLRAAIEGVRGEDGSIPFTELPRLGGPRTLRGYVLDRYRDRIAAVGTLEYRYPVHKLISGALFVDAGEVAPRMSELFSPGPFDDWKVAPGFSLILHGEEHVIMSLDVAYGDGIAVFLSTGPLRAFKGREKEL